MQGSLYQHTSLGGTSKIFDAAKNMSGAGFKFSNASADTIASNLLTIEGNISHSK